MKGAFAGPAHSDWVTWGHPEIGKQGRHGEQFEEDTELPVEELWEGGVWGNIGEAGKAGRLSCVSQVGLRFLSNQATLVPSVALNVKTVTVMRRTWVNTVTSAR
jgi:hypothetical protein